jgi:ribosomal protein S18 acetylase RimI-like enzyme
VRGRRRRCTGATIFSGWCRLAASCLCEGALWLMVRVSGVGVEVEVVRDATDEALKAFDRLLPQLSRSAQALDAEALRALVTWPGNRLLVARVGGDIVGALTLVMFPIPTGWRAWIEDVVVDEAARGQGVGAALTREAVRLARADGARTVDLTSRPSREAANRLYERLGFQLRDSKVYRLAADL